jgi:hypothetical protein
MRVSVPPRPGLPLIRHSCRVRVQWGERAAGSYNSSRSLPSPWGHDHKHGLIIWRSSIPTDREVVVIDVIPLNPVHTVRDPDAKIASFEDSEWRNLTDQARQYGFFTPEIRAYYPSGRFELDADTSKGLWQAILCHRQDPCETVHGVCADRRRAWWHRDPAR